MSRIPREKSEGDIYHVMNRGVGQCIIFEDDEDRNKFLQQLGYVLTLYGAKLHAWCLMENHFHLMVEVSYDALPKMMQWLDARYALYFNGRHGRSGRLFGGPYRSEPVKSDEHYLTVLRYIHRNPVKAGMTSTCDYVWSSYREYTGVPGLTYTDFALSLLAGEEGFRTLHEVDDPGCVCIDASRRNGRRPLTD